MNYNSLETILKTKLKLKVKYLENNGEKILQEWMNVKEKLIKKDKIESNIMMII